MGAYSNEDVIRFVEDDMLPEERRRFVAAMAEDSELSAAVSTYQLLKETLSQRLPEDVHAAELRRELKRRRQEFFGPSGKVIAIRRLVAAAAGAAAIVMVILLLRHTGKTDYMGTYGHIDMQVSVERGSNQDSLLQSAALFFNEQAYDKAVPILDQYLRADSSSATALFYRGIARLRSGAIPDGLNDLDQVFRGASLFKYDAAFYTALYYAQQQDKKDALAWLRKIPADAAIAGKAAALEKELK
ncbi:hypothetical protein [Chitinophaga sp. HK235]|uniref:hypothetical protein n=1 Tax=Chitinophaga sp. HK235 TaxID=2952571 RepID=UPI001BABCA7E|nr:hypothetical protein [Chitinophaga sp. HK235]